MLATYRDKELGETDIEFWRRQLTPEKRDIFDAERLEVERVFVDLPPSRRVYVSVYGVTLEYGGNAEGGWWFDCFQLERSESCANTTEAVEAAKARAAKFVEENAPEYEYHSVLGGFAWEVVVEAKRGASTTRERPRYE